jgi:hypothetical protein
MSIDWISSLSDEALRVAFNTHVAGFRKDELNEIGWAILDEVYKRMVDPAIFCPKLSLTIFAR